MDTQSLICFIINELQRYYDGKADNPGGRITKALEEYRSSYKPERPVIKVAQSEFRPDALSIDCKRIEAEGGEIVSVVGSGSSALVVYRIEAEKTEEAAR